jgi:chromosomal replication initiator protein
VTIDLIQKKVGEQFGLREQDLKIRSNIKAIAFPRQIAMYLLKQLTRATPCAAATRAQPHHQ